MNKMKKGEEDEENEEEKEEENNVIDEITNESNTLHVINCIHRAREMPSQCFIRQYSGSHGSREEFHLSNPSLDLRTRNYIRFTFVEIFSSLTKH